MTYYNWVTFLTRVKKRTTNRGYSSRAIRWFLYAKLYCALFGSGKGSPPPHLVPSKMIKWRVPARVKGFPCLASQIIVLVQLYAISNIQAPIPSP